MFTIKTLELYGKNIYMNFSIIKRITGSPAKNIEKLGIFQLNMLLPFR